MVLVRLVLVVMTVVAAGPTAPVEATCDEAAQLASNAKAVTVNAERDPQVMNWLR
jgi:hypothetical protein